MIIFTIAGIALREIVRRKLVLTAVVLTFLTACLTGWGFDRLAHHPNLHHPMSHEQVLVASATILILLAYMFSLIFALGGAFIAAPAVANEIESGLLLPVLTRPIKRSDIVVGKFFGLGAFLCLYAFLTGLLEFSIVRAITGYWPPHPLIALSYLCGVAIVMLALSLLLSTRLPAMAGGVACVVFFGIAWMLGIVGDLGQNLHNNTFAEAGVISQLMLPSDAFWRAAVYHLEPVALIATLHSSAPFAVAAPPPVATILWGIGWIVVVLAAATWSISARDI